MGANAEAVVRALNLNLVLRLALPEVLAVAWLLESDSGEIIRFLAFSCEFVWTPGVTDRWNNNKLFDCGFLFTHPRLARDKFANLLSKGEPLNR